MTREELETIFEKDSELHKYKGDNNAFLGLEILSKYTRKLIQGAEHDVIFSCEVDEVIDTITKEDADELRKLNWMIDEEWDSFACFV